MKSLKFTLMMLFSAVAINAMAWTAEVNKAIVMFAEQNLSNKTKKRVESILDKPLNAVVFANKGKNQTRLNEAGKSVTTDEKDAVVRLEKALSTFNNDNASMAEIKAALLDAIELTVDIHCPSNILIDKKLEGDFTFGRDNGRQRTRVGSRCRIASGRQCGTRSTTRITAHSRLRCTFTIGRSLPRVWQSSIRRLL